MRSTLRDRHVCQSFQHFMVVWCFYLFRENVAGSATLTEAMKKELGAKRVAEPRDKKYSANHDISNKKVYEWWKKEAKARSTYYNHYSPCCKSFSAALRGLRERSKDAP